LLRKGLENKKGGGMSDWMIWWGLAAVLVIFEMFTGTFYLLMCAIGLAAGGLAALLGAGLELQLVVAASIAIASTYGLRRSRFGKTSAIDATRDPNVNLDIGQALYVGGWSQGEGEAKTARVAYRGAQWDVELAVGEEAVPGSFVIREVRGSRLIVAKNSSNNN
jgi:membrane protein implicated in regulation of membrane protease activity